MCGKIYKAVSENFVRQMRNWALTSAGASMGESLISSCYTLGGGDRYPESREPVLIGEAEDVGMALGKLPNRYKQAVSLFWQYEGRPMVWFARRCGEGVDWRTYERRVMHGHELLKAELARQAENVARYRSAVMKTQIA